MGLTQIFTDTKFFLYACDIDYLQHVFRILGSTNSPLNSEFHYSTML